MRAEAWHRFRPDEVAYDTTMLAGVLGHRRVTDACLAALARYRGGRVAGFDRGFAWLHHDVVDLIPTDV